MKTFNFCPNSLVPETLVRENVSVMSLGGWQFTARPTTPFQRRFKVTLHGLQWQTRDDGRYDPYKNPETNAHALEKFYQEHEMWKPFQWQHPHIGFAPIACRFFSPVNVPAGLPNSNGLIGPVEVNLIEYNPGY